MRAAVPVMVAAPQRLTLPLLLLLAFVYVLAPAGCAHAQPIRHLPRPGLGGGEAGAPERPPHDDEVIRLPSQKMAEPK